MELPRFLLAKMYCVKKKSVPEIARILKCSEHKVNYWLARYGIQKRSISEAIYTKYHPKGDPFLVKERFSKKELKLLGLGLGLYWGEGNKKNKVSIRLGNTDPRLVRTFIDFLVKICGVKKKDIGFNLLIFSDINPTIAKMFWVRALDIRSQQIRSKVTVIKSGSIGTYRQKAKYGVLILEYHNRKLRDIICGMIEKL
ncbi:helix-turn-helix domain-containing protein [Candidatus Azambacteria bacterium]|nr:helix-turn-helix domain-containing protein [Candidatus Azambacteria bacterium]MBI3685502.1 helix-turn-helix domain-containing protein [Candidatus Azambacteria bacterium]